MIFLDSELTAAERAAETARLRVIPVPLERTVSYGAGTARGPEAIIAASDELERVWRGGEPCASGIHTEAPVDVSGPLPEVMARIAARTAAAVRAGALPVTLGGEHSLSYGAVLGVAEALGAPVGILQIDAHADLRRAYQGEPHSHASVMQLLAGRGHRLAQYGVRAFSREEAEARRAHAVHHVDAEALVTGGIMAAELPADFPEQVYVSFDLDGLDPAILPATGTPVPGGLGFYQALGLVRSALRGRVCAGLDVVELAPREGDTVSDFTAAQVTYALMAIALGERD
ncbi:agmatinase [Paralimibaculum aggregatum]|uniref:Agmatinase n=1 Tax=Paralimibaculum aggregatum TaxID=3036245 RepID=A0ABQ6LF28_9RHOB|nr:agmatinase family protein [Limibaculum sp. NKW23]GMG81945.1 agmatinase [Limibaculum sp. NKW23]